MHAVTNIQKYSIHDGDGIRTTVFFKGCHLRCVWCHNPETQKFEPEMQVDVPKCTACGRCVSKCPESAISIREINGEMKSYTDRTLCKACGRCVNACVQNLRTLVGTEYTVKELVKKCLQDQMFYEDSGGGVTLSGGEVMAVDNDYVTEVCKALHREGVSVDIDTCGEAPYENYKSVLPYVDTFLYDIKVMDNNLHKKYIGRGNEQILSNLVNLAHDGARIYLRIPVVKEVNGNPKAMQEIIEFLKENSITPPQVNLLPYHSTGSHKYAKLGRKYLAEDLTVPTDEEMNEFAEMFREAGIPKVMIGG